MTGFHHLHDYLVLLQERIPAAAVTEPETPEAQDETAAQQQQPCSCAQGEYANLGALIKKAKGNRDLMEELEVLRELAKETTRLNLFVGKQLEPRPRPSSSSPENLCSCLCASSTCSTTSTLGTPTSASEVPVPESTNSENSTIPPLPSLTNENAITDSAVKKARALASMRGLAIGDSLGSTSEFQIPWFVGKFTALNWPDVMIGTGSWTCGAPTDDTDMAMALLRSFGGVGDCTFNGPAAAKNFVTWLSSGPADVGATTRFSLSILESTKNFDNFSSGAAKYHSGGQANGSLMRNGAIAAGMYARSEAEIVEASVLHGIITHYGVEAVLCCVIHSVLIHRALNSRQTRPPTLDDIRAILAGPWTEWKNSISKHPEGLAWCHAMASTQAEVALINYLAGFENLDPYHAYYKGISGYCSLSLKIALWALHWSFSHSLPSCGIPHWLPLWPFQLHHFEVIKWVVLIGADADTYGAIAGPLLGAYHPETIPQSLIAQLEVNEELQKLFA
ncbi:ADP-ribosylglycohydrolase [Pelomyxa schiedti]|nr:ADP-ribosylglycohydrolase [Pelomyxa schiedti]